MFTWIAQNVSGLGIFGAAVAFAWSIIRFVLDRQSELRSKEFDAYHRLIKELVAPDSETKVMWIDRQVAVVFELRHFPRYYEVSSRILKHLKEKWSLDSDFKWKYLLDEVELTLRVLKKRTSH
jgi:hypothetical protein